MSPPPLKVILDVDTGQDDAVAILLAARHLDVLGITTVAGNQSLEKVTRNTLKVLELAGLTALPVAAGMSRPLVGRPVDAAEVHGESGLDGADLPEPTRPIEPRHAVDFIVETVMQVDDVALVPTAPLTNIATALRREPRLVSRIKLISLMGGSLTHGNQTPAAEFNIWSDPEAAAIVFSSGVPIKMCGLNVTRQVLATPARLERLRAPGNRVGLAVADMLEFYGSRVRHLYGLEGAALHDPCAVAALIDPSLLTFRRMHVDIELHGTLTRGMTVCDVRHFGNDVIHGPEAAPRGGLPNAEVAVAVDVERFFDLLLDTLATYP